MFGFWPAQFDWSSFGKNAANATTKVPKPGCDGCDFIHEKMKGWRCDCECHLNNSNTKTSFLAEEEDTDHVCGSSSD